MPSDSKTLVQAVFIVPPKVHLLDITGPAHIFYEAADYGAPVKVFFCTMAAHDTEAVSSSMLSFHQLTPYVQLQLNPGDLLFLPGLEFSLLSDKKFISASKPFIPPCRITHMAQQME